MIGLSTSWNAWRNHSGQDIIKEIVAIGFTDIELNYHITEKEITEISKLVKNRQINVTSLHNFCPVPDSFGKEKGSGDLFLLSSLNKKERIQAVCHTKITIDYAKQLNAKAVVLHLGKVCVKKGSKSLINAMFIEPQSKNHCDELRRELVNEREQNRKGHMDAVLQSLEELNRYARSLDIKLGIENKFFFEDIPSINEIGEILATFCEGNIFYWHDSGHAQMLENLGFLHHEDFLKRYSDRLIGTHLHDMIDYQDHQAPGTGNINFSMLKKYLKPEVIKIMEINGLVSREKVISGYNFLRNMGI
ncbi:MAG: TIM barrel protein [Victivallales bacterium]|jgi:sugar phosphate isomerase/epimerase